MHASALPTGLTLKELTLHSGLGALALWTAVLWNELPRLAYGPICGEATGLFGHCPLCAPAAVLTAISLAGLATMARRSGRRVRP